VERHRPGWNELERDSYLHSAARERGGSSVKEEKKKLTREDNVK